MGLIAKNAVALVGSQIATWMLTLLMLIVVPQYLGDQQFGQFSVASSLVAFFGLFAALGAGQFIVKQVARDGAYLGPYVFNALVMSVALAIPLSGAAVGTAYLLGYSAETVAIVAVACGGMTLTVVNGALISGLQGQQRMRRAAVWGVIDRYISGAAVLVVLATGHGLLWVAMASCWSGWVSLLGNGAQIFRQLRDRARIDLRIWKILAVGGTPFVLWNFVLLVYGSIDIVMLSKMAGDAVVGWYTLAYRFVGIPVFLASIVVTAMFPQLSAYGASESPSFAILVNRAVRLIFFVTAAMAAGIALVVSDLLSFLHYSKGFTHAVPLVWILALHIPVVGITTVLGSALMARDRQKQWVVVGVVASVFNPLLNLLAIPATSKAFGDGAIGASAITVITECVMLTGALYLLRSSGIPDRQTLSFVARCVVACALMVGVVVTCRGVWLPARILTGALVYGFASAALGTLSVRELRRRFFQILTLARARSAPSIP